MKPSHEARAEVEQDEVELTPEEQDRFYTSREWKDFCKWVRTWPTDALPGRNDQCDCGSGKKFKKCCGE